MRLFQTIILRHFRSDWGKVLLSVLGVAIGVTVVVAIRLANTTAFAAFTSSLDVVAGRANLQVLSNDGLGFDERFLLRLRQSPAVEAAAPVVEQYAQVDDVAEAERVGSGTPVLVLGIDVFSEGKFRTYQYGSNRSDTAGGRNALDFLSEPNAIIITDKLARQYGLLIGDSIPLIVRGRRYPFSVAGIIEPQGTASALGGNFALLDIASAQEIFDRIGKVDRIDLLVPETEREELRDYLSTLAPTGVVIREPAARGSQATKMVDAFSLNLNALSFIALFVSMFIIYNTMLTSTLRRRRELGILRAVGATRSTIMALFLSEAALIGLIGTTIGLPLGVMLAQLALEQVTRTVTSLYVLTVVNDISVDALTLILAGGLGIVASIVSALPPAIEASRVHPRETFSVQTLETRVSRRYGRIGIASLVLLVGAWLVSLAGQQQLSPMLGFTAAGLLLVGTALLTPGFITLINRLFGWMTSRLFGVEGELAGAYLMASLARTSTAVAALMTSIAMLIGISTMVGSFRATMQYWLEQTIHADLYVTISTNRLSAGTQASLPEEVVRFIDSDSIPGLKRVEALKPTRIGYAERTIVVSGARLNLSSSEASLSFKNGTWDQAVAALDTGTVIVSEAFELRFNRGVGDTIVLTTPSGSHAFTVAGIYYDYSTDAGAVIMKEGVFQRFFLDSTFNNLALYLSDPSLLEQTRATIEQRFGAGYSLLIYSNRTLRQNAMEIFDQTFAITYALQLVAIIVAAIGVANTLAAMVLERAREIGILKTIGATSTQIRKMTLVQAGMIGLVSQTLGVVAGLALSAILIYVINRASFGWTIQLRISPDVILTSTLMVFATAFLAGIAPANAAAHRRVAEVVKTE